VALLRASPQLVNPQAERNDFGTGKQGSFGRSLSAVFWLAVVVLAAARVGSGTMVASASSTTMLAALRGAPLSTGGIAFDDDGRDVWRVTSSGGDRQRLTSNEAPEFDPSWSPDARAIAYRSETDGNSEIYAMKADGTDKRNLTHHPATDYSPSWSPDGARIAFASDRGGARMDIYVMGADGSGVHRLTRHPSVDEYPTWSPDGRRIAFHSDRSGHWEVYVISVNGTHLRRLTRRGGKLPSWSPRGTLVAFTGPRGSKLDDHGMNALWLIRADGRRARRVARNAFTPEWSPNGQSVLVSRPGNGLVLLARDGKVIRRIGLAPAIDADWVGTG
jgi:Tol biopolymer transport system component